MNYSFAIPVIQTDRLTLREYRHADFNSFAQHLGDPESMAHIGLADHDTAWRIFSGHAGLWVLHGAGWWAVEMRQTGEVIGNVGAFFRPTSPVMEVGWNTYRAFWGRGFAREAAEAAVNFAFEVRREPKIQALIDPGNESSLRVAHRLGLAYESETEIHGKTVGRYTRHLAPIQL